jgi:hypothetical protein
MLNPGSILWVQHQASFYFHSKQLISIQEQARKGHRKKLASEKVDSLQFLGGPKTKVDGNSFVNLSLT